MNDKHETSVLKSEDFNLLKLEDIRVQSFVTALTEAEKQRIRGGDFNCPDFANQWQSISNQLLVLLVMPTVIADTHLD